MGFFDTFTNMVFGTERVKASKAECKTKKEKAKNDYDAIMNQIEAECEASLTKAKEADKATLPTTTPAVVIPKAAEASSNNNNGYFSNESIKPPENRVGGKKGGKSKKRSKSNRKKTARKH